VAERWKITLLGGLSAERGDERIARFPTQKTGALLAYLAYHLRTMHSREFLIALLWPDAGLASGRNSLSVALSSLRNRLEPPGTPANSVLRADRFSVGLNPDAVSTDTDAFEAALNESARAAASTTERLQLLGDAVRRYTGPLLPDSYEEWVLGERERLSNRFFEATGRLIRLLEETGDTTAALGHARHAAGADPLREEGHEHLIRLLAATASPARRCASTRSWSVFSTRSWARSPRPRCAPWPAGSRKSPANERPPSSGRRPHGARPGDRHRLPRPPRR
jgi:DNA-binding SARP family transcriptional activator